MVRARNTDAVYVDSVVYLWQSGRRSPSRSWRAARRLRRGAVVVVLCAAVVAAASAVVGHRASPTYTATATLNVGGEDIETQTTSGYELAGRILASSYVRTILSDAVIGPAARALHESPRALGSRVDASQIPLEPTFAIAATGASQGRAVRRADAVVAAFRTYLTQHSRATGPLAQLQNFQRRQALADTLARSAGSLQARYRLGLPGVSLGRVNQAERQSALALLDAVGAQQGYLNVAENSVAPQVDLLTSAARQITDDRLTRTERDAIGGAGLGGLAGGLVVMLVALAGTLLRPQDAATAEPATAATHARGRSQQIDILKGLAIVGVMFQHAFTGSFLRSSWDTLHVGQAVPVFFVLMGLNASGSLLRRGTTRLREMYNRQYLISRLDRLGLPFAITWVIAVIAALALHRTHFGSLLLIGVLPMQSAPGNYFVTILGEFAIVFPLVFWCFRRHRVLVTLGLLALNVEFELVAAHVSSFAEPSGAAAYLYEAVILKYAVVVVAGMWLAEVGTGWRLIWLSTPVAAVGVVYLVLLRQHPDDFTWLVATFSRSTNFISAGLAIWITLVGLRLRYPRILFAPVAAAGRASFEIFLLQIVWFGLMTNRSVPVAVAGILLCSVAGFVFYAGLNAARRILGSRTVSAPITAADD